MDIFIPFEFGQRVKFKDADGIEATISQLTIQKGPRVLYQCHWFEGGKRVSEWFEDFELESVDDVPIKCVLGFRVKDNNS